MCDICEESEITSKPFRIEFMKNNLLLLMLLKSSLFDEILITFVTLVRERDSVRVLLMLKPPAAGGEGGAANRAQGSPLLGLICGRGTFCRHPCILRGQHILSLKKELGSCSFLFPLIVTLPDSFCKPSCAFGVPSQS